MEETYGKNSWHWTSDNPAWSALRAVREGRFHTLDHTLYNVKPNARWGEANEQLADILYPTP